MSTCQNNPNESSTTEINKHVPSVYSLFTHCSFDKTKNKLNVNARISALGAFLKFRFLG